MRRKHLYLAFCVIGFALPYSQFLPWLVQPVAHQHGLNLSLFVHDLFANRISAFFGMDVIVSAVVLISFARAEATRLGIRYWWIAVVATCAVGVSLGFPLFLYLREQTLETNTLHSTK